MTAAPLLTFELYLDDGSTTPSFQPLLCSFREGLMPAVLRLMEEQGLRSVEVREQGSHLFILKG